MFICSSCGYGSASWIGRCPNCSEWNTLTKQNPEQVTQKPKSTFTVITPKQIVQTSSARIATHIHEFDRVLGGGFVKGQVVLLSGEPGVGKSTLLLQALRSMHTLYICGEESPDQIKERADRMKIPLTKFSFSQSLEVEAIIEGISTLKPLPEIIVVDSIQTLYSSALDSSAGSAPQLRQITQLLVNTAKKTKIPFVIVGHITKDGDIAGPKMLEHMVDTVLTFEGEKMSHFRIIRVQKNRFGPNSEIGIFAMKTSGLEEVNNPLAFVEDSPAIASPGRALVGVMEGHRPLFFEIQTLAVPTNFPMPRRVVKGLDYNKVLLLLAVVRKFLHTPLDKFDIYVNVVGGVDIQSPSADLGCIASLLSSIQNQPLPDHSVYTGEVGLLGEVRSVFSQDKMITEAKRLGYRSVFSSKTTPNVRELNTLFIRG